MAAGRTAKTAKDAGEAASEMRYARRVIESEHLGQRALGPEDRHSYADLLGAEARWERTLSATERARAALSRLADQGTPRAVGHPAGTASLCDLPAPARAAGRPPDHLDYGSW